MPYLTPETVPESTTCRALLIPDSAEWLAVVSGALTELTLKWNWQQQGITVDDALAVVADIINGYYEGCVASGCQQPDGEPVFRLNPETWAIEELVNGEWVAPTGDATLPPTPPRGESTPEERRCLAAANAANCLEIMYESLSDSFNEALGLKQAIEVAFAALVALIGSVFGLPLAGLVGVFVAIMSVVYTTIEYLSADLWDDGFTDKLTCYLYECSTDDGDVVHFDIQCIINKIGSNTTWDLETEYYVRLFLQVSWLLQCIGAQALDAAGATTQIDDADCDACEHTWCYVANFEETDGGFVTDNCGGVMGDWVSASGWLATDVTACGGADRTVLNMSLIFDFPVQLDTVDMHYDYEKTTSVGTTEGIGLWVDNFSNPLFTVDQAAAVDGLDESINVSSGIPQPTDRIDVFIQPTYGGHGGLGRVIVMQLTGHEEKPVFLEALGWVECPPP